MGQRLGQHFLKSRTAVENIVQAADIKRDDLVLEIGPGKGVLTEALLQHGAKVMAVEKDPGLIAELKQRFQKEIKSERLILVSKDIRSFCPESHGLEKYKLVANIPYYITGALLRKFLSNNKQPGLVVFLVQHEIAKRIATSPKESILSVSVKAYGEPRYVEKVPKRYFSPPPKVDSAILSVKNISKDFFRDLEEECFFRVLKAGFAQKRKFLANNLREFVDREKLFKVFKKLALPENVRPEDVPVEKWRGLVTQIGRLAD